MKPEILIWFEIELRVKLEKHDWFYRNLNRRPKVINVNVKSSIFFASKAILITLEAWFKRCTVIIKEDEFFFVDIFIRLQGTRAMKMLPDQKNKQTKLTLADLTLMFNLASVEHWTLNSKSRSGFNGILRKLICLMCRSSFFDRLKVNWKSSCKS